jgi:sec-independent protein translocase protein TatC
MPAGASDDDGSSGSDGATDAADTGDDTTPPDAPAADGAADDRSIEAQAADAVRDLESGNTTDADSIEEQAAAALGDGTDDPAAPTADDAAHGIAEPPPELAPESQASTGTAEPDDVAPDSEHESFSSAPADAYQPENAGEPPDWAEDGLADSSTVDEGIADAGLDDDAGEGSWLDAPESDEERPLVEHLDEMFHRLAIVLVVMGLATAIALPLAEQLINFLWDSFLPAGRRPRIYNPLELVLTELKVAALVGFVAALPATVYETYLFMRPGLYDHERKYYLASVPTSLVLAVVGVVFSYLFVLPVIFSYFTTYTERAALIAFALRDTFDLIIVMMASFALIFQIPLFIGLAIMMGVTTREWMENRRLYFWGGFLGVAFLFSPDPTGMAPVMVAATMVALFEGTLALVRWTGSDSLVPTADGLAAYRVPAWAVAGAVGYLLSAAPVPRYYEALPATLTDLLVTNDLAALTPYLVAGVLIGLFELLARALRGADWLGRERHLKVRIAVAQLRYPVWIGAAIVGYLGSPTPTVFQYADRVSLASTEAAIVALALVGLYELAILGLRWREPASEQ